MKRATRKDLEERLMRAENLVVVLQHRDDARSVKRSFQLAELSRLNAHVAKSDEALHKLQVQLADEMSRRHTAEETASAYLKAFTDASELAAERGKINSVLVRRINELEQDR